MAGHRGELDPLMSLKAQLLVFGLLTLALPWAGFGFVEQMEGALRQGLESSLLASAGTAATVLANDERLAWTPPAASADVLYAHRLASAPRIDGYRSDWRLARRSAAPSVDAAIALGDGARAWLGVEGRFAYVHVDVPGDAIVYPATPGEAPFGDRVVLLAGRGPAAIAALLTTTAPGQFRASRTRPGRFVPLGGYEDRVLAAWQETADGYSVEARLPLELAADAFGIAVIDVDRAGGTDPAGPEGFDVAIRSTWGNGEPRPTRVVTERPAIETALARLGRAGDRYRVIDRDGWVLADSGTLEPERAAAGDTATAPLSERLLRAVLRRNDPLYDGLEQPVGRIADPALRAALAGRPATAWYRRGPESEAVVAAAVPIATGTDTVGALVLEQASDSVLTLSNQARMRLMIATLAVSLAAAALLLGYASFLSMRIGRLARAAETALAPSGELTTRLPGNRARDEIGDLSRSFGDLLGRLDAYTGYLRTLTGKLAHEIRTPIAIVSTSLDNLEQGGDDARVYLERMRQGTARLDAILTAMSAATRVEQAVTEAPVERYDLAAIVGACAEAYRGIYPDRRFVVAVAAAPMPVSGSSDLLAQLLDKLVDNAVGFSAPGSEIGIRLAADAAGYELSVTNEGPPLPAAMRHQVFDSLVSIREHRDGGPHLGLGLYIVALVARFHRGRVEARDLPDGSGVAIVLWLPRDGAGAAA